MKNIIIFLLFACIFTVNAAAPNPVTNPQISNKTATSCRLSWTSPTGPYSGFFIIGNATIDNNYSADILINQTPEQNAGNLGNIISTNFIYATNGTDGNDGVVFASSSSTITSLDVTNIYSGADIKFRVYTYYDDGVEKTYSSGVLFNDGPLPVELTSFTSLINNSRVNLKWSTATETNNNGFAIERKSANTNWSKIGFVNGNGNSNSTKNYSFVDNMPLAGKTYYRLKQVDNDGKYQYSKEIEVIFNSVAKFDLSPNYPNPFNPTTVITYQLPENSNVVLKIYNILGKEVASLVNAKQEAGSHSAQFNASNLSSGLYIAKLQAGSFTKTIKMNLIK